MKHYKTLLKFAIAVGLFVLILFEGKNQIKSIHPASTLHAIRTIPVQWLLLFLVTGIAASFSMVLYDLFAMRSFRYDIRKDHLLSISFVSNALNGLLGLGGLTGASVKTLLLKKRNIEVKEMISYNTLVVSAAGTGLSFLAFLTLFNLKGIEPLLKQHKWLWACVIGYSLYIFLFFFLERIVKKFRDWSNTFGNLRLFKLRLELTATSIIEWIFAGLLFYILSWYFKNDINLPNVISVYTLAAIAGILSFLPGGVGSFDLIAIFGLQQLGIKASQALTVVILYRIFYYFVPTLTAIIVFSLQVLKNAEEKAAS